MYKLCLLLAILIISTSQNKTAPGCKLKVFANPDDTSTIGSNIQIYPTSYSSPIDNLNNHLFTIFKAVPADGCTRIQQPNLKGYNSVENNPYLVVIDGQAGFCGYKRRIQMAKDVGAKGVIILSQNLDQAFDPYGDYNDRTFLVFMATSAQSKKLLSPSKYIVASLSSAESSRENQKPQIQIWLSTLDQKSYQLLTIWDTTLKQMPLINNKVNWRPRYALWGCNSGLFTPGSACLDNPQYISSCACAGQFCSPQTKYKGDAIVKQDIRQKLIFKQNKDKYLAYINQFYSKCFKQFQKQFYAQDCAVSIMLGLGIDYNALQQKIDIFMTKCSGDIYQTLLLDRNRYSQLGYYPALVLDRQPIDYSGKRDLQSQLCRRLGLEKQQGCTKVLRTNTIITVGVNILFFILIIGGLIAIVFGLLFLYRKTIRKEMQKQMKMQVSASVEHYFALTESK